MYSKEKIKLEDEIDKLSSKIKQQIANSPFNAFNGLIASKMLKAANEFEKESNKDKNIVIASKDKGLYMLQINNKNELIDYVHKHIVEKYNRTNFTKNDIINILLCISQGFLTVFAGPPGTGKTSLCEIVGKIFGISRNDEYNS